MLVRADCSSVCAVAETPARPEMVARKRVGEDSLDDDGLRLRGGVVGELDGGNGRGDGCRSAARWHGCGEGGDVDLVGGGDSRRGSFEGLRVDQHGDEDAGEGCVGAERLRLADR